MSRRKPTPLTVDKIALLRACPAMHVYDAIEIYQIGRNTIYKHMHEGTLSYRKLGGITLLSVAGLEALVRPEPKSYQPGSAPVCSRLSVRPI